MPLTICFMLYKSRRRAESAEGDPAQPRTIPRLWCNRNHADCLRRYGGGWIWLHNSRCSLRVQWLLKHSTWESEVCALCNTLMLFQLGRWDAGMRASRIPFWHSSSTDVPMTFSQLCACKCLFPQSHFAYLVWAFGCLVISNKRLHSHDVMASW